MGLEKVEYGPISLEEEEEEVDGPTHAKIERRGSRESMHGRKGPRHRRQNSSGIAFKEPSKEERIAVTQKERQDRMGELLVWWDQRRQALSLDGTLSNCSPNSPKSSSSEGFSDKSSDQGTETGQDGVSHKEELLAWWEMYKITHPVEVRTPGSTPRNGGSGIVEDESARIARSQKRKMRLLELRQSQKKYIKDFLDSLSTNFTVTTQRSFIASPYTSPRVGSPRLGSPRLGSPRPGVPMLLSPRLLSPIASPRNSPRESLRKDAIVRRYSSTALVEDKKRTRLTNDV